MAVAVVEADMNPNAGGRSHSNIRRLSWTFALAVSLAVGLLMAGCSAQDAVRSADAPSASSVGTKGALATATPNPRDVVRQGRLLMRTADPEKSEGDVQKILDEVGGFVLQSDLGKADGRSTLTMVVKVPVERFGDSLSRMAALGYVRSKSVTAQDVTERVADLKKQQSELQARAKDPSAAAQLGTVQQALSETLATSRYASIELTMEQETTLGKGQDDGWFRSELGAALTALGTTGRVVVTMVVWLLVFSPLWGTVAWGAWAFAKHQERSKPPKLAA